MIAAERASRQTKQGGTGRWAWAALLPLITAGIVASCGNPPLVRPPPPVDVTNNELELEGTVCPTPPSDAVFPVKILFLVDTSGSLVVTDPADVRGTAISQVIKKYQGLPGLEFDVITFSSAIVNVTNGFTSTPDLGAISAAVGQADNLTDDQGALAAAYNALTQDMLKSTPAERARSRYIVIMFTDGTPDPLCSADTTPCGSMSCMPHSHCVPTTVLNASSQQQEQYACDPDYLVCTVPKKNWATAFNPPVDPSLYPDLLAGANYNTTPQLVTAVTEMMALQKQYHVGSIELDTNLLFPVAALSNPLAVPFDLDLPAAQALLQAMAAAGNGTYQVFTSNTDINFLNINFSSIQVNNDVVITYATNTNAIETGSGISTDTDADGLSDDQENGLGTCAALGTTTCKKPWDSDGDGYGDFIEVQYEESGFDPLDPTKPTVKCVNPGVDTDGDGLMDCEEVFLKTDPLSPDTDGDLTLDNTEVRTGLNPLDPTDAMGDINKDGILNQHEVQLGLTPVAQVSTQERQYALTYAFDSSTTDAAAASCYQFAIQHLRLMDTGPSAAGPGGVNHIYYDLVQTGEDSPTNLALVRRACATVLFENHIAKVPLSGVVSFVDSDFVDLASFDPAKNCKDLTEGVVLGADGGYVRDAQGQ